MEVYLYFFLYRKSTRQDKQLLKTRFVIDEALANSLASFSLSLFLRYMWLFTSLIFSLKTVLDFVDKALGKRLFVDVEKVCIVRPIRSHSDHLFYSWFRLIFASFPFLISLFLSVFPYFCSFLFLHAVLVFFFFFFFYLFPFFFFFLVL